MLIVQLLGLVYSFLEVLAFATFVSETAQEFSVTALEGS